jgi:bleomycin hydrolase
MARHIIVLCLTLALSSSMTLSQTLQQSLEASLKKLPHPEQLGEFPTAFHLPPRNQDTTNVCWSFATSSFIETEMNRLHMKPVPLAMMYFAYCAFVEKTREFVRTKGASRFSEGDLFGGVIDNVKKYGILPLSAYPGQTRICSTYNNGPLMLELESAVKRIKADSAWNEEAAVSQVTTILDTYLGRPPANFLYEGRMYSPATFRDSVVRLPWNEYVIVTSFMYAPFGTMIELKVPDNWKHAANFYNVPLDVFYDALKKAIDNGYTAAFDADISEPSYKLTKEFVFIPDFDIPPAAITQEAREFRFQNGTTTDDHLMHIIGHTIVGGEDWYLVKDSWRTAHEGPLHGYIFMHGSYVKAKVLAFLVHKDAIPGVIR